MQKLSLKNIILIAALAFGLGLLSPHISSWLTETPLLKAPVEIKEDNEPIVSDDFSLRLLKAATVVQPTGNIILAPDSLATTLLQMIPLAAPEVEKALQELKLSDKPLISSAYLSDGAFLFADSAANLNAELTAQYVLDVPLSEKLPETYRNINLSLQNQLGEEVGTPANGETVGNKTHLLAVNGINISINWSIPVSTNLTTADIFHNANGGTPQVRFMNVYTQHYAEDPQGNWKAAAIRLDRHPRSMPETPDCYLILLQPTHSSNAHNMAAALTGEQFSAIRTALRESSRTCSTKLPRLNFSDGIQNSTPLLKAIGIDPLFTSATPFAKLTEQAPWAFTTAWQFCRVVVKESPQATVDNKPIPQTSEVFDCNRPFIWFLMPISSPLPPYAMGVVENL